MLRQKLKSYLEYVLRIYGSESEGFSSHWSFLYSFGKFVFIYLGIFVLFLSLFVILSYQLFEDRMNEFSQEEERLAYWENVVELYPNYPDAFYLAGFYAYRLEREELALSYLNEAILLDKYFDEAIELREEIRGVR